MKNTTKYALFGAALALITPAFAAAPNCPKVSTAVKKAVVAHPDKVLELVAAQVAKNQSCAGEIVKAAIIATKADKALVANIVNSAVNAAPSKARVIGQSAVAVAPDALAEVQAVVAKAIASNERVQGVAGEKGGKAANVKAAQNPLDFPNGGKFQNPVGPLQGGPGGSPLLPRGEVAPTITPPSATDEVR